MRITLGATAAFLLLSALTSWAVLQRVNASLEDDVRAEGQRAIALAEPKLATGADPHVVVMQGSFEAPIEVRDAKGDLVAGTPAFGVSSSGPVQLPLPAPGSAGGGPGPGTSAGGGPGDALFVTQVAQTPSGQVTIVARPPLDNVRNTINTLRGVLLVLIPFVALVVAAIVWLVVDRALRPVEKLRAEVDQISHSTLTRRLPEPGTASEIDHLARTMNEMLDRLEVSAAQQRQFVSDAGHELKTPLATLRSTVEVARRHHDPDWDAVADRVLASEQRLEVLVDDLLTLARFDEGIRTPDEDRVDVDLDELVLAWAAERAVPDAIAVDLSKVTAGRVRGDERELRRLVGNLLDNALEHAQSQVAVSLGIEGPDVVLRVDDDGPGIPLDQRTRVFERFTRVGESRARSSDATERGRGTGIGLAIARACTLRHAGAITITDSPLHGARFEVHLPAS